MKENISFQELLQIIKPYVRNEAALKEASLSTRFIEDLKVNSARLVDIVIDMEDKFNISISDDEAEKIQTIGAAIELLQAKK